MTADAAPASRPRWPGTLAFALALLTIAGLVTGVVLGAARAFEPATWVAWGTIGMSGAAALLAFVALVAGLGRGRAVAALVLAVLANPYLLTQALAAIGRLWM